MFVHNPVRVALGATLLVSSVAAAAPGDVVHLGNLFGSLPSYATGVNDAGDVVGYAQALVNANYADRAVIRPATGGAMQDLGTFNGFGSSRAMDINNAGVAVGWATGASGGHERAFYLPPGGSITELGVSNGAFSRASAINDFGDVVGHVGYFPSGGGAVDERAFLRRASDGVVTELPRPDGATAHVASDVNDAREVVGHFYTAASASQPFLWREATGQLTPLGTFGGAMSFAYAINDRGDVVGASQNTGGQLRAFIRSPSDDAIRPLGALEGTVHSDARDINDLGFAAGATLFTGTTHATLWDPAGEPFDLDAWLDQVNPDSGADWKLITAMSLNDSGTIVGYGEYNDGVGGLTDGTRAFMLDASSLVPEPAVALLALPAVIFSSRLRRRSR